MPAGDFPTVTLAPFGAEQVRAFTATWYRVVGPAKDWSSDRCDLEAKQLASVRPKQLLGVRLMAGSAGDSFPWAQRLGWLSHHNQRQ